MRPPAWTQEEQILVLDLYFRLNGIIPDTRDADVIALSAILGDLALLEKRESSQTGRSKSSIIFKLSNFRSLDPAAKEKGKHGLRNFSRADREVWNEFSHDPEKLKKEAAAIRAKIAAGRSNIAPLRANLHILRLLGDELIGSPRLAVFELLKNAYDADATSAEVIINLDSATPSVTVEDNGTGMSIETIRDGWLQIGTPSKRGGKRERTKEHERLPLGEKGVGRLAAFRLGNRLEVITREKNKPEYRLIMDMQGILTGRRDEESSIEDVRVWIETMPSPVVFPGDKTGTRITITALRDDYEWNRGELRGLHRLVNSLNSPFEEKNEFSVSLAAPGRESAFKGLMNFGDAARKALWTYTFSIDAEGKYSWQYEFLPPATIRGLTPAATDSSSVPDFPGKLEWHPEEQDNDLPSRPRKEKLFVSAPDLKGVGPLSGKLYVFDRRNELLKRIGSPSELKKVLDSQSGVRVYRDGIRVFNYGEQGNDWLDLNIARVNSPGEALANNAVFATIDLDAEQSSGLTERTNREGFHENDTFFRFKAIIKSAIGHFNIVRRNDRSALDLILKKGKAPESGSERFSKAYYKVMQIAEKHGVHSTISGHMAQIKKEYEELQQVVVSSGAGLNIAIVFHEVERGVDAIIRGISAGEDIKHLEQLAQNLGTMLDGFGNLLKNAGRKTLTASTLIKRTAELSKTRFAAHHVTFSAPVLVGDDSDFKITGAFNFYLQAMLNLIDNAIYWSRRHAELHGGTPAIQIRTLPDWAAEGPSIAVIDNGPGFSISQEEALKPFLTTRTGGMGLGLYYSRMAMDANGGDLLIPDSVEDLDIETGLSGGAVVLRFAKVVS